MTRNNTTEYMDPLQGGASINFTDNLTSAGMSSLINQTLLNESNVPGQGGYVGNEFVDQFVAYSTVIVSIVGIMGNVLCLIVMLRPPFNEMAHSIICASLALVDLAFMVLHLAISLTEAITGEHLIWLNRPLCKFGINFAYLCLHLDAWIITGLSLERVIAVFRPLHAAQIITKLRIKLLLTVTFVFFVLFNGESSIRYDLIVITIDNEIIKICQPAYFYGLPKKYLVIKDQIAGFFGSFIPLIIITVCNVALLIKLARRRSNQSQLGVSTNESEKNRTNRMIITVMVAFTVLLSPAYIYVIAVNTDHNYNDPVLRILALVAILNPAINFWLYFLSASLFRNAVKNMFPFLKCSMASQAGGISGHTARHTGMSGGSREIPAHPHLQRVC